MSSCGRINNFGVFCALLAEVIRKYAALSNDPATDSCNCAALLGLRTKSTYDSTNYLVRIPTEFLAVISR